MNADKTTNTNNVNSNYQIACEAALGCAISNIHCIAILTRFIF